MNRLADRLAWVFAILAFTLLLAAACTPTAYAASPYSLADRQLACTQIMPALERLYESRTEGLEPAVTWAVDVLNPELSDAQRYFMGATHWALYDIPVRALPALGDFQYLIYGLCVTEIGSGFLGLPEAGPGINQDPNRREVL